MKRFAENQLLSWFKSKNRKPLILRGGRQVGKSTLVRLFATQQGLDLVEVNLELTKLKTLQKENLVITQVISEIESLTNKRLSEGSLLFFDEIQAQPKAIEALRYFYELVPDKVIICAGSLLELVLGQTEIAFPVGRVSFYYLGPMTFCEFLLAQGRTSYVQQILNNQIEEFSHEGLIEELKKYFFVGGMPRAVLTYSESQSLLEVSAVHRDLALTYQNDFPKYYKRLNLDRTNKIFEQLPYHLGKKIIYQHLDRESRSVEIKKIVNLMLLAHLLLPTYHCEAGGVPLRATVDYSIQKMFFLDIGLLNFLHRVSWREIEKVFEESFGTKGLLAEQFIAQHLAYRHQGYEPPELFYWLRDKSTQKAELDFVIESKSKVLPIEVKASRGGRLRSLLVFAAEKNCKQAIKFSCQWFSQESLVTSHKQKIQIQNIPLYAVEGWLKSI